MNIKEIEYYPDGTIKRIEYYEQPTFYPYYPPYPCYPPPLYTPYPAITWYDNSTPPGTMGE